MPLGNWAEWVAALGTTGALIFALIGLHIERAKNRALAERQNQDQERSQARLVAGWMHDAVFEGKQGFPDLLLRVRNGSDLPVYMLTLSAEFGVAGTFHRVMGSLAPHETREMRIPVPSIRPVDATPSLMFTDAAGLKWYRTSRGDLRQPTVDDQVKHRKEDAGAYIEIEKHPTLTLAQEFSEQHGYRVE